MQTIIFTDDFALSLQMHQPVHKGNYAVNKKLSQMQNVMEYTTLHTLLPLPYFCHSFWPNPLSLSFDRSSCWYSQLHVAYQLSSLWDGLWKIVVIIIIYNTYREYLKDLERNVLTCVCWFVFAHPCPALHRWCLLCILRWGRMTFLFGNAKLKFKKIAHLYALQKLEILFFMRAWTSLLLPWRNSW